MSSGGGRRAPNPQGDPRAADKETFAAALGRCLLHDRLTAQTERVRRYLGDQLRPGLPVSEAGQRYCALASLELYYVVTVEFGWTTDQHRKWLTDLLENELLGPRAEEPSVSGRRRRTGMSR